MYYVPLGREMCLWMGGVDASRSTGRQQYHCIPWRRARDFPTDPNSKEVRGVAGFSHEKPSRDSRYYSYTDPTVLKNRLGFIKLAMRQGADLVPTSSLVKVAVQHVDPVQECDGLFPKDIRHPCPDLLGQILVDAQGPAKGTRYGLVYGKPITMKQTPNPTDEEVRAVHAETSVRSSGSSSSTSPTLVTKRTRR
ncbi:Diacylglycerol acyltransferase [Phytophthora cactorum]|nr:Diacylglycerol acyltransferase [Phytophthora cactorum]